MFIAALTQHTRTWKQVSIDGWLYKENVVSILDRVLFTHMKEGNIGIYDKWMDLEGIMLNEVNQADHTVWSHLNMECKNIKLIETVEWWMPGG